MTSRRNVIQCGATAFFVIAAVAVLALGRSSFWWQPDFDPGAEAAANPADEVEIVPGGQHFGEGPTTGPLECRLLAIPRPRPEAKDRQPELRIELINVSKTPVSIHSNTEPSFHTTFLVRDGDGKIVSSFMYMTLSSSFVIRGRESSLPVYTFQPGEPYVWYPSLWVIREYSRPALDQGKYRLEALFTNKGIRARSGKVGIVVGPDMAEDGHPAWNLDRP
jgi:hypothetical protein